MVDSANPCGLSVLVFLLIAMAVAGSRKRILLVGGVYIAAMFLFHLLVGIGLFSVFSLSGLSRTFAIIGGAIALILGIITIVDVIRNKDTFVLSIPESKEGLLGDYIRIASLPAAFILGILAGILCVSMDILDHILFGFGVALQPLHLLFCFIGVLSPRRMRPSRTATSKAKGIEAADVLP